MNIANAQRKSIGADNHEAVKIGDEEKNSEAIKVARPKFNQENFSGAVIREGVEELTLQIKEVGTQSTFIIAANGGPQEGGHSCTL